jgi:ribonucleoside-diphosphate reductase beta chain
MSNLFKENLVYRPFTYPWAIDFWEKQIASFWVPQEIPMGDDVAAWKSNKLTPQEKDFVQQVLRMFTQADVNVGTMYLRELIPCFKNNEAVKMLSMYAAIEGVHQSAYALEIDTLGFPEGEYAAFLEYKEMADKHEFMLDVDTSTTQGLALALAKGVFNEGVSLFASFVMLLNFQRRGLLTGAGKIVAFSIRDENLHVEGVSKLFRTLCEECPEIVNDGFKHRIYDMARKVVELEDAFIRLAYRNNFVEGLSQQEVQRYIRYITDRRLNQLGLKENFMIDQNPLPWVDWIVSGAQHTNFFEQKVSDYTIGGLQGQWQYDSEQRFLIYTRHDCPWCVKAKELVVSKGHTYCEIDVSDYDTRQLFFDTYGFSGANRTVPQIFSENNDLIGGYTELSTFLS